MPLNGDRSQHYGTVDCLSAKNTLVGLAFLQIILGLLKLWQQRGAGHRNHVLKEKGLRHFKDFTRRQMQARMSEKKKRCL